LIDSGRAARGKGNPLAIRAGTSRSQLAWIHHGDDTLNQLFVYHAHYIEPVANANYGEDWYFSLSGVISDYLWECHQVEFVADNGDDALYQNVSIQVDNEDNPVIAFNIEETYFSLGALYGNADGSYDYQQVDSPRVGISTGKTP
jgi:hypothetical protein